MSLLVIIALQVDRDVVEYLVLAISPSMNETNVNEAATLNPRYYAKGTYQAALQFSINSCTQSPIDSRAGIATLFLFWPSSSM